jgi:acrosin
MTRPRRKSSSRLRSNRRWFRPSLAPCAVEELESRLLLAVTGEFIGPVLALTGTGPDTVELNLTPTDELEYSTDNGVTYNSTYLDLTDPTTPVPGPFPFEPLSVIDVTLGPDSSLTIEPLLADALKTGGLLAYTGIGSNTFQGNSTGSTWTITGPNSGYLGEPNVTFLNVGNLAGGTGQDTFNFEPAGSLTGSITGGGTGGDTINWSAAAPQKVSLTGNNPGDGAFSGSASSVLGGFSNIDKLVGSTNSTLTGLPTSSTTWTLNASGTNTFSSTNTLDFQGFSSLVSGAGSDTFDFNDGAVVSGSINGGNNSTLNWSSYTSPRKVALKGGTTSGFSGTDPSLGTGFSGIGTLVGPATAGGTLTGLNATATWTLARTGASTYTSTNALSFSGFNNLIGEPVSDTFDIDGKQPVSLSGGGGAADFVFADGSSVTGSIDGGTGKNGKSTLDWSSDMSALHVTLIGLGRSQGFKGTEASIGNGFNDIDTLAGGTAAGVVNMLTGTNAKANWTLPASGPYTYVTTNTLTFTGFTNLIGGTVSDIFNIAGTQPVTLSGGGGVADFIFADGSSVTGSIDGGTGKNGKSTLDWTKDTTALSVSLTSLGTSQGFAGTEPATILQGFNDIDNALGGSGVNGLTGLQHAPAVWNLTATGPNTYKSTNLLSFTGFANLVGGTVSDTFNIAGPHVASLTENGGVGKFAFANGSSLANGPGVTAKIDAGTGASTLTWSAVQSTQNVVLSSLGSSHGFDGTDPLVEGGFANIDVLQGRPGTGSLLTGMKAAATWTLPATGADTYTTTNTLTFTGFRYLIGSTVSDTFNIAGTQPMSLFGGGGTADFVFADKAKVTGSIDGGTGAGTLDWTAYSTNRRVTLTSLGQSQGFAGLELSIGGEFQDIDTLLGGHGVNTLTGTNAEATWSLGTTYTYTSTNALTFAGFTRLSGGNVSDTFKIAGAQPVSLMGGGGVANFDFAQGASVTGSIDGGATGPSTLDWSADSNALSVKLIRTGSAQGFAGTEASIGGGFNDIDTVKGGTGVNTLTGLGAAATWNLPATGLATYTSTNTAAFSGFASLVGGSVSDTFAIAGAQNVSLAGGGGAASFVFGNGASVTGTVDGGTGKRR